MKKRRSSFGPAIGGSSLLAIFGVLCLTVFALLSLTSVQAERRLADAAVQSATDYNNADLLAQEIFSRVRSGEQMEGVQESEGIFTYVVEISDRQSLYVELQREEDTWTVCRWQTVTEETVLDEGIPVWRGEEDGR